MLPPRSPNPPPVEERRGRVRGVEVESRRPRQVADRNDERLHRTRLWGGVLRCDRKSARVVRTPRLSL